MDQNISRQITKKPLEVRMGKGKGAVEYWAAVVKPEELCLKLEDLCQLQRGVTSCSSKASSKN
jgi:ribosomal protein L16/L10AE